MTAPAALKPAALKIDGLSVAYGEKSALLAVDATFPVGTMSAIIGPNGAGKSTLLKAALGILTPLAGRVAVFGAGLEAARNRIAYVPQRASVDWDFPALVLDVVMMGLYRQLGLLGRVRASHRAQAMECLDLVGMSDFAGCQIGQLSGGQQQRVFLARALAQKADLYLLDEPLAGVDAASEAAIIGVLHGLRRDGRTVIAVHHELGTVAEYFDRVLLINIKPVAEGPVATAFTAAHLQTAYGGRLASLPKGLSELPELVWKPAAAQPASGSAAQPAKAAT